MVMPEVLDSMLSVMLTEFKRESTDDPSERLWTLLDIEDSVEVVDRTELIVASAVAGSAVESS
jgi:hypothetical protein